MGPVLGMGSVGDVGLGGMFWTRLEKRGASVDVKSGRQGVLTVEETIVVVITTISVDSW
jgi:hypothetical protein